MGTQHWVEPTPWSQTKCPHSPKRMALDAAQKNQHVIQVCINFLMAATKLHETWKNFRVSETGTPRNVTPQKC